jgi:hypothetical protein
MAKSVLKEDNICNIIDVDSFEFEGILEHTEKQICKGYTLCIPNGKSPHTVYPFALHDTLVLPWDIQKASHVHVNRASNFSRIRPSREFLHKSLKESTEMQNLLTMVLAGSRRCFVEKLSRSTFIDFVG